MLRAEEDDDEEENEVPDDEIINQIVARFVILTTNIVES